MPLEIAVAGCGPGGLTAALALARLGHKVVLFDQFDEPRPLGSGLILQPTGLAVLDWLGVGDRVAYLGARIERLFGRAGGSQRIVLDVTYQALGDGSHSLAVHRAALFAVLYDAVREANLRIETSCKIVSLDRAADRRPRLVTAADRILGPFDLVVDALGTHSPLMSEAATPVVRRVLDYGALWASLKWTGPPFDRHALEQRYDRASVMAGVLPIGRQRAAGEELAAFFWSLKIKDYPAWRKAGLERWKSRVRVLWPATEPFLDQIEAPGQMTLAEYGHHTLRLPYGERIAFIGDSAHSTSPQLGQGANMALLDVAALSQAFDLHANITDALVTYARLRRSHVRFYQALSRVFTPFYQSDSTMLPLLRDWLVAPASRIPGVPRLLSRTVAGLLGLELKVPLGAPRSGILVRKTG